MTRPISASLRTSAVRGSIQNWAKGHAAAAALRDRWGANFPSPTPGAPHGSIYAGPSSSPRLEPRASPGGRPRHQPPEWKVVRLPSGERELDAVQLLLAGAGLGAGCGGLDDHRGRPHDPLDRARRPGRGPGAGHGYIGLRVSQLSSTGRSIRRSLARCIFGWDFRSVFGPAPGDPIGGVSHGGPYRRPRNF